jgi:hypothetical protein
LLKTRARREYKHFVKYMNPAYDMQWFHEKICDELQLLHDGHTKKLMIFMPPQHGKTELATRSFPPFVLGNNPNKKIAIVSYAASVAERFSRTIQRNIDNPEYHVLFPETKLNNSSLHKTRAANVTRTTALFEVVGYKGSVKSIGRGGPLTSEQVDLGIIDDPLKDRAEASSETIRSALWSWYTDVFLTRLHNDSQQLIIQTRWDEKDLAGRILSEERADWKVISFPAIKTDAESLYDPRRPGEVLWPAKHSIEEIRAIEKLNEVTFNSLYQQDPKPNTKILVYKNWRRLLNFPGDLDPITWGLDFGKSTGINALVRCATNGMDAYVQECLYAKAVPVSVIVAALKDYGYKEGQIVWCDHIPDKIIELKRNGIAAFPAVKGPGSVKSGIDKLNEYNMHYIGDNIHMELGKYQFVTYDDIITQEPVDDFNHALDATRYGLLSRFFRGR